MLIVPLESFSPSYRGKIGTWCRSCFAAYQRARSRGESVDEFVPKGMHEARQCDYCRASYIPKQLKLNAAYCSRECKRASRNAALQDTRNAAKPSRECPHCGTAIGRDRRSDAIFCSAECNSRAHALQRKLRARTGQENKPGYLRAEICSRDRWRCGICGKRVNPMLVHPHPRSASLDHIVPVSQGGLSEPANLRLVHLVCNIARHNRGGNEQIPLI